MVTSYSSMVSTCLFSSQHGSNGLWASLLSPCPQSPLSTELVTFIITMIQTAGWNNLRVHLGSLFQRMGFFHQGRQGGVYTAGKCGKDSYRMEGSGQMTVVPISSSQVQFPKGSTAFKMVLLTGGCLKYKPMGDVTSSNCIMFVLLVTNTDIQRHLCCWGCNYALILLRLFLYSCLTSLTSRVGNCVLWPLNHIT